MKRIYKSVASNNCPSDRASIAHMIASTADSDQSHPVSGSTSITTIFQKRSIKCPTSVNGLDLDGQLTFVSRTHIASASMGTQATTLSTPIQRGFKNIHSTSISVAWSTQKKKRHFQCYDLLPVRYNHFATVFSTI